MVVDWYGHRPIVEELHLKGMKTGCGVEALQFTTEGALAAGDRACLSRW